MACANHENGQLDLFDSDACGDELQSGITAAKRIGFGNV